MEIDCSSHFKAKPNPPSGIRMISDDRFLRQTTGVNLGTDAPHREKMVDRLGKMGVEIAEAFEGFYAFEVLDQ
jgi:hypothetical protein